MQLLERVLWQSRLIVVVAVIASVVVALGAFYMATVDVIVLLGRLGEYADLALPSTSRDALQAELLTGMVRVVDGYLFGAIMLIFALGLYELFVAKIQAAEGSDLAARVLLIRTLDDLKDRLAKVVMLILVIKFFQQALSLKYGSPLDLLYLALGTLLVGAALYLTSAKSTKAS